MFTAEEDYEWPVACRNCRAIVSAKINRAPLACAECGSTDVTPLGRVTPWPELTGDDAGDESEDHVLIRWGERVLDDSVLICPRCGATALRVGIEPGILFD